MKLKIKSLQMFAMIICLMIASPAWPELKRTQTNESTTFSDEYPEYTAILKAMTPDQKEAVKALAVYERDRAVDEAIKIVIIEKEPEIEYWKTEAELEKLSRIAADKSKTGWKITALIAATLLTVKTVSDIR